MEQLRATDPNPNQAAELARDLLLEAGDCDEEQGEEDASDDAGSEESDGASDGGD